MNEADQMAISMATQYMERLFSLLEKSQETQLAVMDKLIAAGGHLPVEEFSTLLNFYNQAHIITGNTIVSLFVSMEGMVGSACQAIVTINK